jgi:hypothetical protein
MPDVSSARQAGTSSAKFKIDERCGTIAGRQACFSAQLAKVKLHGHNGRCQRGPYLGHLAMGLV